jgi:ABC-type sugar transport system substrate-binding protein
MRAYRRKFLIAVAAVAAMTVSVAACGNDTKGSAGSGPAGAGGRWTAQEVAAAVAPNRVTPVYEVPKSLKKKYKLAFLNPSTSYPFFASWSDGMKASAKFYGVELIETNLDFKYDQAVTQMETIAVQKPDVVGSQPWDLGFETAATNAGAKLLLLDNTAIGVPSLGIPDSQAGVTGADELVKAVQAKRNGAWKDRDLVFVGLDAPNCLPCRARLDAALAQFSKTIPVDKDHSTIVQNPPGQDYINVMTDLMTAHPKSVFAIISFGDDPVIEAVQALTTGGRAADGLGVMLGAATTAQEALRKDNAGVFVGALDFNPFQEGWNWVEAAIALAEGEQWKPYEVSTFVTKENVDKLYPAK